MRPGTSRLHSELRNVRVVGHTPKTDHYIYDIVIDFADSSERVAAKVYRSTSQRPGETSSLLPSSAIFATCTRLPKKKISPAYRVHWANSASPGIVVAEKLNGLPLQSIVMKAALLPGYSDHSLVAVCCPFCRRLVEALSHAPPAEGDAPFDGAAMQKDLEHLCANCKGEGLDDESIGIILDGTRRHSRQGQEVAACVCSGE